MEIDGSELDKNRMKSNCIGLLGVNWLQAYQSVAIALIGDSSRQFGTFKK